MYAIRSYYDQGVTDWALDLQRQGYVLGILSNMPQDFLDMAGHAVELRITSYNVCYTKLLRKFFCENCGAEVRQNDKVCQHCGRFFASVKCPSCGFSGEARVFRDGCPACGYAVFSGRGGRSFNDWVPEKKREPPTDPLPWWIYFAALLFLMCLVGLILLRR